jgi:AcrR family transcriptional regulator
MAVPVVNVGDMGMRADAQRNRARVLEEATAAFADEGLSVPVAEIARRAGVGTGTVSRHFPTKESLYEAIVLSRVEEIVGRAHQLIATRDPGAAFFEYFAYMVEQAAARRWAAGASTSRRLPPARNTTWRVSNAACSPALKRLVRCGPR